MIKRQGFGWFRMGGARQASHSFCFRRLFLSALAMFINMNCPRAGAAVWPDTPPDKIAAASELIIRARALSATSYRDDSGEIVTDTIFEPIYKISGETTPPGPISIRTRGGYLASEDLGLEVTSEPDFRPGEDWVVMLGRDADNSRRAEAPGCYRVSGGMAFGAAHAPGAIPLDKLYAEIAKGLQRSGRKTALPQNWKRLEAQSQSAEAGSTATDGDSGVITKTYVYNGQKWSGSPARVPFYIRLNGKYIGPDGSAAQFLQAIINAADGWNLAPRSDFQFAYSGDGVSSTTTRDGRNEVMFQTWNVSSGYPPLAETLRWHSGDRIIEADTRVNDTYRNIPVIDTTTGRAWDLHTVMIHEFGHWLSLGHDSDPLSVMTAGVVGMSWKRLPAPTDEAGITAIYPNGANPPAPPHDWLANAAPLCGGSETGTLVGGWAYGGPTMCAAQPASDFWYRYAPAYDGDVVVGACESGAPNKIELYQMTADGVPALILCGSACRFNANMSQLAFRARGGVRYIIRLLGTPGQPLGMYRISLAGPPCAADPPLPAPQAFDLVNNAAGWTGGVMLGQGAVGASPGGVCMYAPAQGDNIIGCVSPERVVPLVDMRVVRLRVNAYCGQSAPDAIPLWDVTYDNFTAAGGGMTYGGDAWFLDVAGGANGAGRPQGRGSFDVFAAPNAMLTAQWRGLLGGGAFAPEADALNDMRLAVRVLDLGSASIYANADEGTICIQRITAQGFDYSQIPFEQTLWGPPVRMATHAAQTNWQIAEGAGSAQINDAVSAAIYQLTAAGAGSRKTLIPFEPAKGSGWAALYPVAWNSDFIYRGVSQLQSMVGGGVGAEGHDPVKVISLNFDTTTSEIGMMSLTTRGSWLNMPLAASPRLTSSTGGPQSYVAFFSGANRTLTTLPDAARLRFMTDFMNTPQIAPASAGVDPLAVIHTRVDRVVAY